ncbi:PREDICTED: uncharacterized protein LOC106810714 [Priapulus caudatus]|uniref:Uncharacterized protein LOC106810714 n=1 Tax=Priapulus caudatus TaxID=37621 RepID=A0ABM1EBR3_PRICU|nr:PREDICTED: uncharacterized protein LOC106810714 [Priapulus caudatus]
MVAPKAMDLPERRGGPMNSIVLAISGNGNMQLRVLQTKSEESECVKNNKFCVKSLRAMLSKLWFHPCLGLDITTFKQLSTNIRYKLTLCQQVDFPYTHFISKKCQKIMKPYARKHQMCRKCAVMMKRLRHADKVAANVSTSAKKRRRHYTSRCPLSALSPASKKTRKSLTRVRQSKTLKKQKNLEHKLQQHSILLNDEQSMELGTAMNFLSKTKQGQKAFKQFVCDTQKETNQDVVTAMQEAWKADQERNRTGSKRNVWTAVSYRIALAIFSRSPTTYKALTKLQILQLPSIRSIQRKMQDAFEHSGPSQSNLKAAAIVYRQMQNEAVLQEKPKPMGEGVLILDEVKVIGKIMWNSKNHEMYGLALTHNELTSLHDIYQTLDPQQKVSPAQNILQFLWRDLTSSFDVIGPYYATESALDTRLTTATLLETMRIFEAHGFHVSGVVFDGASTNLATVKLLTTGKRGPYQQPYDIQPWFTNPYRPQVKVHFVICPSHQLKNMVNALHNSRPQGTRDFMSVQPAEHGTRLVPFGWQAVQDMYAREVERRDKNCLRMVPGLQQSFIVRDAWTKLNVKPAKIMQQEHVLAELKTYAQPEHTVQQPIDAINVLATVKYLTACNLLFERGLLSHAKVTSQRCEVLDNIVTGYAYFENWHRTLKGAFTFKIVAEKDL